MDTERSQSLLYVPEWRRAIASYNLTAPTQTLSSGYLSWQRNDSAKFHRSARFGHD